jgi:hypothetical protein
MRRPIHWVLVLALVTLVSVSAVAQNKAVPVIAAIEDTEEAVAPALQIRSDGRGVYVNSPRTLDSVIQSVGDWVLATNLRDSTRTINIEFSQAVSGSGPGNGAPIVPPVGPYNARFIAKCHDYGTNFLTMNGGQTIDCPLTGSFPLGDVSYRIQMNSRTGQAVYPLTDYITVTCTSAGATTPCSQWRIEPSGTFTAPDGTLKKRNRAKLIKITTSKGKTIETDQGDFYFSFQINLTKE